MEELRSTQILDNEIKTDSLKKAKKIVEQATAQGQALKDGLKEHLKEAQKTRCLEYEKDFETFCQNQKATLPLEKQRAKIKYEYEQIIKTINSYLQDIGEKKRQEFLIAYTKRFVDVFNSCEYKDKNLQAYYINTDETFVSSLIKDLFGRQPLFCKSLSSPAPTEKYDIYKQGIIIETQDKKLKVTIMTDDIVRDIYSNYSSKLCFSLFGR